MISKNKSLNVTVSVQQRGAQVVVVEIFVQFRRCALCSQLKKVSYDQ
jgi:hypothetical protein